MKKKKILIVTILFVSLLLTSCETLDLTSEGYTSLGNGVYEKYDPFYDLTYYRHESSYTYSYVRVPVYVIKTTTKEIEVDSLVLKYQGSDWIFFKHAIFLNNKGDRFEIDCDPEHTITHGGGVIEKDEVILSVDKKAELLEFIRKSEVIYVRFVGKYYKEYTLSDDIIHGIEVMLNFEV